MNLFFVIKTVIHLLVTTFFECEMKISYKEYISESENMASRAETDSKIRELKTCLLFSHYWNIPFNDTILSYFIKMKNYHIF